MNPSLMRTIIVEDEPLAREGLMAYIKRIRFLDLINMYEDGFSAMSGIAGEPIDLLFLDIHMPGMSGLDFLKKIKKPPLTIITTAFPNFALEGYELEVIDYLVKPYPFERFVKAVQKAKDYHDLVIQARDLHSAGGKEFFFVKCESKLEKIFFEDILFIKALENYVIIHKKGQQYITKSTMKELEKILPSAFFVRTHKSFIVSIKAVSSIGGNVVSVEGHAVPVSRDRRSYVIKYLTGK